MGLGLRLRGAKSNIHVGDCDGIFKRSEGFGASAQK